MTRLGPLYVHDGYVIGHVQDEKLVAFYLHQFEIVRRATLLERLLWRFIGKQPAH